jgi:hypothetical protein
LSNLVVEILLRLLKPLAAAVIAVVVYLVATALGEPGSIALFLIAWLVGAAFILLVQEGPI